MSTYKAPNLLLRDETADAGYPYGQYQRWE